MSSKVDMSTFKAYDGSTFKSKVEDIVLNADADLGDVYLASWDRQYFLAHRIVLVSASRLFRTLLSVDCNYCNDITDDKVVIIFAGISGTILKNFLSLIYTGTSDNMDTVDDQLQLQHLCRQFQLHSVVPTSPDTPARSQTGYKDVKPPECYTNLSSFMHMPAQVGGIDNFLDVSINEAGPMLKMEPVDYDEDTVGYDDYYDDDQAHQDYTGVSTRQKVFNCHLCSKEFKNKSSLTNHLNHCNAGGVKRTRNGGSKNYSVDKFEPEMEVEEYDEDVDDDNDVKFDPDFDAQPRKKRCKIPEVDYPFREENGLFFCLSGKCKTGNQSFKYESGLKEHYFEKHASKDQKHFPCQNCGMLFGTNGLRNRHFKKCCPDNEASNDSSSLPLKRRSRENQKNVSKQMTAKKDAGNTNQQQLDMPMIEKNGYLYCMSGTCSQTQDRCFLRLMALKEHFYDKHATDDQKHFQCEQCGYRFGTNGLKNRHVKIAHPESVPRSACPECSEEFDSATALKNHMKEEHEDSDDEGSSKTPFVHIPMKEEHGLLYCLSGNCELESLSFQSIISLKEHFYEQHATEDQKHFPCKNCDKIFGTKSLRNKHQKNDHFNSRTARVFSCSECSESFNYGGNLKKHMLKVHSASQQDNTTPKDYYPMREENGRFYCLSGECEKKNTSFQYSYGLREHYFDKHATEEEKLIPCNVCDLKFGTKSLRNRHHKNLHPDEPLEKDGFFPYRKQRFDCKICQRTYFSTAKLEEHMKIQHSEEERPFVCQECGKTFKHKNNLGEHMEIHSGILITCDVCGLTFKSKSLFKQHYKMRHTYSFACTLCDKRFGIESQLKTHMHYHTGEKPFVCEACGKSYHIASALASHMGRHHKPGREKKFPCDMCDKQFFEPNHLQRHRRFVHLKERNFHCEECGNSFRDSFALKNHMEKHEGISYPCKHCAEKFSCQNYLKKHMRKRHRDLMAPKK